ncbi:MAG: signal peptide peptidase SppA [Candidatus Anstonellaceae archaeon]
MNKGLKKESQPIEISFLKNPIFSYLFIAFAVAALLFGFFLLIFGNEGVKEGSFSPLIEGCVEEIEINGQIVSYKVEPSIFQSEADVISSLDIKEQIDRAEKNKEVKGYLVVIDSPGGSVVASQEIYNALKNSKKPKVAYFRELAASGGYYVALATDYIVSEPAAITGSIGARMTLIELSGLFEKIGINQTNIKSGELKDIGDISRKPTEREIQLLQRLINETFEDFREKLISSRGNKIDQKYLDEIYSAAIFSGKQAYTIGLVDELGGKEKALEKLSSLLNYNKTLKICPKTQKKGGLLSSLISEISPKIQINIKVSPQQLQNLKIN